MLCLLCSLSGIKCLIGHAYTLLLHSTDGRTWAWLQVSACMQIWLKMMHFGRISTGNYWTAMWWSMRHWLPVCEAVDGRWSKGRLSEMQGYSCEQMPTPFQSPLSQLVPIVTPSLLGKRGACFNPDYQAEAHQLRPFLVQNTYSSNTAIHTDKHMKCMNKAQRENEWVMIF